MIYTTDLEKVWPEIVGKITAIMERYPDDCDWTEEDIYCALRDKRAFLFQCGEDDSFAICKIKPGRSGDVLFIWIADGICGKRERNIAFLREIARSAGASRMEWESPRRGFDRMQSVHRGMTKYSMEV